MVTRMLPKKSPYDRYVHFIAESTLPIHADDALGAQAEQGFHPEGYGFYRFQCEEIAPGAYQATWMCASSCD